VALSSEQERARLLAIAAAQRHGIPPELFVRQLWFENQLRATGRSGAGAQGIAQFMPGTAPTWGVDLHDGKIEDDIDGAARYMAYYSKKLGGYRNALIAYNAGPRAVGGSLPAETRAYIDKIMGTGGGAPGAGGATAGAGAPSSSTTDTGALLAGLLRVGLIGGGAAVAGLGVARMAGVRNPGALKAKAAAG
jgi:hypothetical protein